VPGRGKGFKREDTRRKKCIKACNRIKLPIHYKPKTAAQRDDKLDLLLPFASIEML
jgi:hypothetical protein